MPAFFNAAGGDRLNYGGGGSGGSIPLPGQDKTFNAADYIIDYIEPGSQLTPEKFSAADYILDSIKGAGPDVGNQGGGNWLSDLANMLGKDGGWKETLQDLALGGGLGLLDKLLQSNPTKPFGQSGMQDVDAYTNPDMAMARAFKTGYGALGDIAGRDYSQYAVPPPQPVSVPGVPFQIGGGLGLDPSFWTEMGNMAQTSALAQQYTQPGPTQRRTGHDPLSTAPPSRGQARRREV